MTTQEFFADDVLPAPGFMDDELFDLITELEEAAQ